MSASYEEDAGTTEDSSGTLTPNTGWTLNVGWASKIGDAVALHIEAVAPSTLYGAVLLTLPSDFWPNQDITTVGATFKIKAADGTVTLLGTQTNGATYIAEALYDPNGRS